MKRKLLRLWLGVLAAVIGILSGWLYWTGRLPWLFPSALPDAPREQRLRPIDLGPGYCVGKYGRAPEHPSIKLERAEFVSPAVIKPGALLELRAYTNKPVRHARMQLTLCAAPPGRYHYLQDAEVEELGEDRLYLWDDGKDGDRQAHDGEWYGALRADLEQDCVLCGTVCLLFADYDRQYLTIQNQVSLDAPGDDAWARFDAAENSAKEAGGTAAETEASTGTGGVQEEAQ